MTAGGPSRKLVPLLLLALVLGAACGSGPRRPDGGGVDATTSDAGLRSLDASGVYCGLPGLSCCAGNACQDGGCCVRGACIAPGHDCRAVDGVCAAGGCGSCGGEGQPCCRDPFPAPDSDGRFCSDRFTTCSAGCRACGRQAGDRCCPDRSCAPEAGLGCNAAGNCDTCGAPGHPCCTTGEACAGDSCCTGGTCVAVGDPCLSGTITKGDCSAITCRRCGHMGEPCCVGDTCGDPGLACTNQICAACGAPHQLCCGGNTCADGALCQLADGFCVACGGDGQACCQSTTAPACAAGLECVHSGVRSQCLSCGHLFGACCPGPQMAMRECTDPGAVCFQDPSSGLIACDACGAPGQPCCTAGTCSNGGCCVGGACVAVGQACPGSGGGVCDGRSCSGCGAVGGNCCGGGPEVVGYCAAAGSACLIVTASPAAGITTRCYGCGKLGQPCCPAPVAFEGESCEKPLRCAGTLCVSAVIGPAANAP